MREIEEVVEESLTGSSGGNHRFVIALLHRLCELDVEITVLQSAMRGVGQLRFRVETIADSLERAVSSGFVPKRGGEGGGFLEQLRT
jgi:hypothetical protein